MGTNKHRFLFNLTVFSIVLFAIVLILFFFGPYQYISDALLYIVPFFIITTFVSYALTKKYLNKKSARFTNYYMIATVAKLIFFALILVVYSILNRADAVRFTVSFFFIYLLYTFFEIIAILKISKEQINK